MLLAPQRPGTQPVQRRLWMNGADGRFLSSPDPHSPDLPPESLLRAWGKSARRAGTGRGRAVISPPALILSRPLATTAGAPQARLVLQPWRRKLRTTGGCSVVKMIA